MSEDGTDESGYWLGWCPLHDDVMDPEIPSAHFNFKAGVLRCLREPSCHEGQRVISLTNATIKLANRTGES